MQQQIAQQDSIWHSLESDYNYIPQKAFFIEEYIKIGKEKELRQIAAFEDHLILLKNNQPHKMFKLVFTSKFETIRDPPQLKSGKELKPGKPPKADDILKMGDIKSIQLSVEGVNGIYEIGGKTGALQKLRDFLGTKINQLGFHQYFKVYKKIGKGSFASVYLADRIEDGKSMAIKAFSKNGVYSEEKGKEGLVNEIMLMRKMNSEFIMKLYEVFETQNSLYMGLEMLEGGQLYEYIKKKVIFQNKEIQTIMCGLLKGLKHMHTKNIMHRDLKLENILFKKAKQYNYINQLISDINTVIIADFGLATYVDEPVYLYCRCGTPGFVAPEVINISDMTTRYDAVCDIYSLGLIFYILLTGKPAFNGRSYNTIVQQNKEAKINFKLQVFDIVPPNAKNLLMQMLEQDPSKRITAEQALKHEYLLGVYKDDLEDDEDFVEEEKGSDLNDRIKKINEESGKFDMLRINQLTNSPIQTPVMQATNRIKDMRMQGEENKMIMRTPVLSGRRQSVEGKTKVLIQYSAKQVPHQVTQSVLSIKGILKFNGFNFSFKQKQTQQSGSILQKYSNKSNVPQQQEKQEQTQVKNVKNNLSKNI